MGPPLVDALGEASAASRGDRTRGSTIMIIYGDIETFSLLNLKERGAYVYATDPSTDLHFFCYAIDDGAVQV